MGMLIRNTPNAQELLARRKAEIRNLIKDLQVESRAIDAALNAIGNAMSLNQESASQTKKRVRLYNGETIKDIVLKGLSNEFPNGATALELLDYINSYRPDNPLERSSLSPQLSRLKHIDKVIDSNSDNIWFLVGNSSASEVTASDDTNSQLDVLE